MPFKLPELYDEDTTHTVIDTFLGVNKAPRIGDGEFSDMQNLTSDYFPNLAVRQRRGKPYLHSAKNLRSISMYAGDDGLFYPVYVDEMENESGDTVTGIVLHHVASEKIHKIPLGLTSEGDKQIITMGAYLIVLPDMMYVNTKDISDKGKIEDGYRGNRESPVGGTLTSVTAIMTMCDDAGNDPYYHSSTEPLFILSDGKYIDNNGVEYNPNGRLWQKLGEYDGLYRFSTDDAKWYKERSYVKLKIEAKTIAGITINVLALKKEIREGDALFFEKLENESGGIENGPHQVTKAYDVKDGGQIIVVEGGLTVTNNDIQLNDDDPFRVYRYIPKLDYVCESGNRLFGCRYGDDGQGNFVNEIYISARGSFLRWGVGTGTDDSPMIFSVGIDGAFTGAITYDGYPTFFKERAMLRVGGYTPADFTLYDSKCLGVAPKCGRSLAVVENTLYYKSRGPVMAFDGSAPVPVSDKLGSLYDLPFAVGGACGRKYYVSMRSYDGKKKHLYVLDTALGLWHREDALYADSMAEDGDNMYIASSGEVWHVRESDAYQEAAGIPWYAESGLIGLESHDKKYLVKLSVRLQLETGSSARVSVQYDSSKVWKQVWATVAGSLRTVTVPVLPIRCDHMRIRIEGVGACRIYSIIKTFEAAEDW